MATASQVKIDMARRASNYVASAIEALKPIVSSEQLLIDAQQRMMYAKLLIQRFIEQNTQQQPAPYPGQTYPAGKYPVD